MWTLNCWLPFTFLFDSVQIGGEVLQTVQLQVVFLDNVFIGWRVRPDVLCVSTVVSPPLVETEVEHQQEEGQQDAERHLEYQLDDVGPVEVEPRGWVEDIPLFTPEGPLVGLPVLLVPVPHVIQRVRHPVDIQRVHHPSQSPCPLCQLIPVTAAALPGGVKMARPVTAVLSYYSPSKICF